MAVIKQYNNKAIVRLKHIYICLDMETGDVKAKGSFEECSKYLESEV